jgi:hypothetical protein
MASANNANFILIEDNWGHSVKVLKENYNFFENILGHSIKILPIN